MRPALIAVAFMVGCGVACGNPAGTSTEGPVLFGKLCAQCHGPTGKPPASMAQSLGVRDLTDPAVRATLTKTRVAEQIVKGSENMRMPGFAGLMTQPQIDALADYVLSPQFLTPPPAPP